MHDLQYNGGKQIHAATGLIAACVHKSALSSSQPTSESTQCISMDSTQYWSPELQGILSFTNIRICLCISDLCVTPSNSAFLTCSMMG